MIEHAVMDANVDSSGLRAVEYIYINLNFPPKPTDGQVYGRLPRGAPDGRYISRQITAISITKNLDRID